MTRPKKSRANELLVAALACGSTKENAAHQAGVSLSTVHRRLADPEFCRQLQAFRADMVQRTAGALTAAGLEFVKTLVGLVSAGTPPATRLGAARAGLELGMKVREVADLEQRLADLERRFAEQNPQPTGD
jgi:hypothetical protein